MKAQEVLSVFTKFPQGELGIKGTVIKMYPELDEYFERGMYVEKVTQTGMENGNCMITFVFRYYNTSQSKEH